MAELVDALDSKSSVRKDVRDEIKRVFDAYAAGRRDALKR